MLWVWLAAQQWNQELPLASHNLFWLDLTLLCVAQCQPNLWYMAPHVWEGAPFGCGGRYRRCGRENRIHEREHCLHGCKTHLWKKALHDKEDAAHSWPTPGLQVAYGMARTLGRTVDHARVETNEAAALTGRVKQDTWEWQMVLDSWPSLSLHWDRERMTAMDGETKGNGN